MQPHVALTRPPILRPTRAANCLEDTRPNCHIRLMLSPAPVEKQVAQADARFSLDLTLTCRRTYKHRVNAVSIP